MSAFEDVLGSTVSEMVGAALEYAPRVDEVLIYFSNENGARTADVAYLQDGEVLTKDHVNAPDSSSAMKRALLKYIVSQVARVQAAADASQAQPSPTAGRIRYSTVTRSVDVDLSYEPELTDLETSPSDKFHDWLQKVHH